MRGSLLGMLVLPLLVSCSGKGGNFDLQPVSGTVKVNGKAIAGVGVTFSSGEGTQGAGGSGVTDESGKYTIKDRNGKEGLPVGKYNVLFTHWALPDGSPIPDGGSAADSGAINQLPEVYSDPGETPHKVEVPAGGKTFDFALQKKK